jgi:short-subunit dehydrogenase
LSVEIDGRWALVTGASSGIGADIARELAQRGMNVLLVARRQDRLDELAVELRRDHSVQAETDACDLSEEGVAFALCERTRALGREISVLVNNAGFGLHGDFVDQDIDRINTMIQLNVVATTQLTHWFAKDMADRGGGYILQVASIGSLNPLPSYAAYAATKAYLESLSGAIAHELGPRNVSVTALLPGTTWTEFFDHSGQKPTLHGRLTGMSSPDVARIGVKAMLARRHSVIAGWRNWLSIMLAKLFPRHVRAWFIWQVNKNRDR